ncbi:MAG TPA: cob(I)yrinic acid a,c-diamide adenosyltransferase [Thermomicrobiales bacterium]|nr:cob(I)yrinic acid a,c-diamide adenosyltransferase [Thermomicrobiales bacterium]
MKIYTARGDNGQTDLLGERVGKDDPRIDLLGDLDETTSTIGLGRAHANEEGTRIRLIQVQRDLYAMMAELAFTDATRPDAWRFPADRVAWLEAVIEAVTATVTLPREFVLPGDTVPGAALDVARTVSRRAERLAVNLAQAGQISNPEILRYLNRLSSLLFILARAEDLHVTGEARLAKDLDRE